MHRDNSCAKEWTGGLVWTAQRIQRIQELSSHANRGGGDGRVSAGALRSTGLHLRNGSALRSVEDVRLSLQLAGDGTLERLSGVYTQLGILPNRLVSLLSALDADANKATLALPVASPLDTKVVPNGLDSLNKVITKLLGVSRGRGDTQALLAAGDGRVVDGLDVDAVLLEQLVGSLLGDLGITDQERDDVRGVRDDGDVEFLQGRLDSAGVQLLEDAIPGLLSLVLDSSVGTSHGGRRKGSSKDETRSQRANGVNHVSGGGNVATDATVSLAQSTGDDINTVHDCALGALGIGGVLRGIDVVVKVLGNTGAVRSVHTNGMDLIQESNSAVLLGKITNLLNGSDGTAHTVHRFESNNLGHVQWERSQLSLEVHQVVVLEDHLLGLGVSDTLNHRGVVQAVGENNTIGQLATESCQSRIVGDVARAEDQRTLLSMKFGQSVLQLHGVLVVTRDVTGTTSASSVCFQSLVHGLQDLAVASHAKVVIGAPDGHALLGGGSVGAGKFLGQTVDVVEVAVRLVLVLLLQFAIVKGVVVKSGGGGCGIWVLRADCGLGSGGGAERASKVRVDWKQPISTEGTYI